MGWIPGIGQLYCYDTALRIAAYRRLEPKRIYLHAGARVGAQALDRHFASAQSLAIEQIPEPLRDRPPHEIENVLCIYRDIFREQRMSRTRC